jgi:hypothetical protein
MKSLPSLSITIVLKIPNASVNAPRLPHPSSKPLIDPVSFLFFQPVCAAEKVGFVRCPEVISFLSL